MAYFRYDRSNPLGLGRVAQYGYQSGGAQAGPTTKTIPNRQEVQVQRDTTQLRQQQPRRAPNPLAVVTYALTQANKMAYQALPEPARRVVGKRAVSNLLLGLKPIEPLIAAVNERAIGLLGATSITVAGVTVPLRGSASGDFATGLQRRIIRDVAFIALAATKGSTFARALAEVMAQRASAWAQRGGQSLLDRGREAGQSLVDEGKQTGQKLVDAFSSGGRRVASSFHVQGLGLWGLGEGEEGAADYNFDTPTPAEDVDYAPPPEEAMASTEETPPPEQQEKPPEQEGQEGQSAGGKAAVAAAAIPALLRLLEWLRGGADRIADKAREAQQRMQGAPQDNGPPPDAGKAQESGGGGGGLALLLLLGGGLYLATRK